MKELTDQQIRGVARDVQKRQPAYYDLALSRAVVTADRALNAPADRGVMRNTPDGWNAALAELRAKVEGLPNYRGVSWAVKRDDVLALIDKIGGEA